MEGPSSPATPALSSPPKLYLGSPLKEIHDGASNNVLHDIMSAPDASVQSTVSSASSVGCELVKAAVVRLVKTGVNVVCVYNVSGTLLALERLICDETLEDLGLVGRAAQRKGEQLIKCLSSCFSDLRKTSKASTSTIYNVKVKRAGNDLCHEVRSKSGRYIDAPTDIAHQDDDAMDSDTFGGSISELTSGSANRSFHIDIDAEAEEVHVVDE
jgi:hypothetical protein